MKTLYDLGPGLKSGLKGKIIGALLTAIILWYPGDLLAFVNFHLAYVGNNTVDLKWDFTWNSTFEYYQILRDDIEVARILDHQVTFYRDDTVTKGEPHTYQLCEAYHGGTDCSDVLTASAGEVQGTLYQDITWEPGEYQLRGDVQVRNNTVLQVVEGTTIRGTDVGENEWKILAYGGSIRMDGAVLDGVALRFDWSVNHLRHCNVSGVDRPGEYKAVIFECRNDSSVEFTANTLSDVDFRVLDGSGGTLGYNDFSKSYISLGFSGGQGQWTITGNRFTTTWLYVLDAVSAGITNNTFIGEADGVSIGIWIDSTSPITVSGNRFALASDTTAILVGPDSPVTLEDNAIEGCKTGIQLGTEWYAAEPLGAATVRGNIISRCDLGIGIYTGDSNLTENTITANNKGVLVDFSYAHSSAICDIRDGCIQGNTLFGLAASGLTLSLDATGNWWGHAAGPEHVNNPGGEGDKIYGTGIDYEPWLEEPNCEEIPFEEIPLYLSLSIEDALEDVPVNKLVGDTEGPAQETLLDIVAKIVRYGSPVEEDIPVVLTVPYNLLGSPAHVYVRNTTGGELTEVGYENLGGGAYRVTTDLSPVAGILPSYRKQVVWRFVIPNNLAPQEIPVTARLEVPAGDATGSATVRILAPGSAQALIITNRRLLYTHYDETEVTSLLQRVFTEAQGPPGSDSPPGVVYYVERYDVIASTWDNKAVDYTSEATANTVAYSIDAVFEDVHDDASLYSEIVNPVVGPIRIPRAYPKYLLIVGDDDVIPFYRYDDPSDWECRWSINSATNPAVHATDLDYYFTDTPYGNASGEFEVFSELAVGRVLGASAADMLSLLREGVDWNNGRRGGVVMASVDGRDLGLEPDDGRPGEVRDLADVPALLRGKGFAVRNDDIPTSEVRTIDVIAPYEGGENSWNSHFRDAANNTGGMDLFFIAGHDSYDRAYIPGDDFSPDDTPARYTRFGVDHPVAMITGCHGGLPVPDIGISGGVDHCMVYDLIHEGARAYIGASGTGFSGAWIHQCMGSERLTQRFFMNLTEPLGSHSMPLGRALAKAKRDYTFGFSTIPYGVKTIPYADLKTVTLFNLYGVPWVFLFYPNPLGASDGAMTQSVERSFATTTGPIYIAGGEGEYTQGFQVVVSSYRVQEEVQDSIPYDLFSIEGGDTAVGPDAPILPFVEAHTLPLPYGATILAVQVQSDPAYIGTFNIPIADVKPFSEGGTSYKTDTDITEPFPENDHLVQYQRSGDGMLFTVFPIQHNPLTDETWFYSTFDVQVTYSAPLTLALSEFTTDKTHYIPGEPVQTTTRIHNVGDTGTVITAALQIQNGFGTVVGEQQSGAFTVPAGGSYVLPLTWVGEVPDGAYTARMSLMTGGSVLAGASEGISVVGGRIVRLSAPALLHPGEEGVFEVSFANYHDKQVEGEVQLMIQSEDGGFAKDLPPQGLLADGGSTGTVWFSWTAERVTQGLYAASARVVVGEQVYGPKSTSFEVVVDDCAFDSDQDGDVDGKDLAALTGTTDPVDIEAFALEFGRADCAIPAADDL